MTSKYIESIKLTEKLPENSYLSEIPSVRWFAEHGELILY